MNAHVLKLFVVHLPESRWSGIALASAEHVLEVLAVLLKSLERTDLASSVFELKLLATHLVGSRWGEIKLASAKYVLS